MTLPDADSSPNSAVGGPRAARRRTALRPRDWRNRWLREPRNAVLLLLASVFLVGGGRKIRQTLHARRAVRKLEDPGVSVAAIEHSVQFGRAGLMELFRLLSEGRTPQIRHGAGHALSILWARDELIIEEEKAIVRRGFLVAWHARRRYPQALDAEIPFGVDIEIPFLKEDGAGVRPSQLEWSFRVTSAVAGARRASLEVFSAWVAGPGRAAFTLVPSDFDADGPQRIVFVAKVRTIGLTESWELELPHVPFVFELDSRLDVASILALPDDTRGDAISAAIRLEPGTTPEDGLPSQFLPLNAELAIRDAPSLVVTTPLPCDLAHAVEIELNDVPGWHPAGSLVLAGQGGGRDSAAPTIQRFPLGPITSIAAAALGRPGKRTLRARLIADPSRGWADPDVRSVWPGTLEPNGIEIEVVRR